jgi:UDP-N-acetylglucosamine--N-acetylmuramyl-(pentapeptide) pyrophosphoryl-undecaprenol N-acetylglucosamine transferase
MNESVLQHLDLVEQSDVEILWQTGKYYYEEIQKALSQHKPINNLKVTAFIDDMSAAYRASDLVVSRAGASSISEFCLLGKPVILVPSPNVAENHQYHNAMALVNKGAAIYVADDQAASTLLQTAINTVANRDQLSSLSKNIRLLGKNNSAEEIADRVIEMAKKNTTF